MKYFKKIRIANLRLVGVAVLHPNWGETDGLQQLSNYSRFFDFFRLDLSFY